nr:MAG: hypothetical protein [Bacteriophage sp.]
MTARFRTAKAAQIAMMNAALKHFGELTVQVTTHQQERKYGGGFSSRLTLPGSDISLTAYHEGRWRASYSPVTGRDMHGFECTGESAEDALRQLSERMLRVAQEYHREAAHISL